MSSQTITSPIPSDLAKIPGVTTGFRPVSVNRGRFVFTGRPGCGKSTLVHNNPKAFILDHDQGGNTVDDPRAIRYCPDPDKTPEGATADAYRNIVDVLIARRKKGAKDIEMIALDTYDELIEIFLRDFCLKHKLEDPLDYKSGEGNAYSIVRRDIFEILNRAYRAGFGWAILVNVTPKVIRHGGEERTVLSLSVSESFANAVRKKCEHFMYLAYHTKTVKGPPTTRTIGGKKVTIPGETRKEECRLLKTKPGTLWAGETTDEVKVRIPFPDSTEIPRLGGWDVFTRVYDEAIQTLTKGVKV